MPRTRTFNKKRYLAMMAAVGSVAFSSQAFAVDQVVTPSTTAFDIIASQSGSFDLDYASSDGLTTTGLGVRLHFDSSKISSLALTDVLLTNNVTGGTWTIEDDSSDFDGDATTDKFINVGFDSTATLWPASSVLYTATFTMAAGFASGSTTINFSFSDSAAGYDPFATSVVITKFINDAPTIATASNITKEATANLTPVTLTPPTATDPTDGSLVAAASNTGPFSVGTTTITWTATDTTPDENGNLNATSTQDIIILDTTAPAITVAASKTVEATGATTFVVFDYASATDLVDGTCVNVGLILPKPAKAIASCIFYTGSAGDSFAVGTHTITWTAEDIIGNESTKTSQLIIEDTTAPEMSNPVDVVTTTRGGAVSVDLGIVEADDIVDGELTPVPSTEGGANPADFAVGVHTVTWTATDTAGNVTTKTQTVTVTLDESSIEFTTPENVTKEATANLTTVMLGSLTYPEGIDTSQYIVINNAPNAFPVGVTTVTWTVTDSSDNSATGTQVITITDTTPPEFGDFDNYSFVDATAFETLLTADNVNVPITFDLVDGEITAVFSVEYRLPSGMHEIIWTATDAHGNTSMADHDIIIIPLANLGQDIVGAIGESINIPVVLSGISDYGAEVAVQLSGAGFETDMSYAEMGQNETIGYAQFYLPDNLASGSMLTATIVDAEGAVVTGDTLIITLTDQNVAPTVELTAFLDNCFSLKPEKQAKCNKADQSSDSGTVYEANETDELVIYANVIDINDDNHTYSWSYTTDDDSTITNFSSNESPYFVFVPNDTTASLIHFTMTVEEEDTEEKYSVTASIDIVLVSPSDVPDLDGNVDSDGDGISDEDEGFGDSDGDGVPNYLDTSAAGNVLDIGSNNDPITADDGLTLKVGLTGISSGGLFVPGAGITSDDIADHGNNGGNAGDTNDQFYTPASAIIDFEVSGFAQGASIGIVLPMPDGQTIPLHAVYRKYFANATGLRGAGWEDFVFDANNSLSSAMRTANNTCPTSTEGGWTVGLTAGHECILIVIEDGGPNDADGLVNGIIVDPAVVAAANLVPTASASATIPTVEEGKWAELDGSASFDPENAALIYDWEQISGQTVNVILGDGEKLSFTMPQVTVTQTLTFELRVYDGVNWSPTITVTVIVKNIEDTSSDNNNTGNGTTDNNTTTTTDTTTTTTKTGGGGGGTGLLILLLLPLAIRRLYKK